MRFPRGPRHCDRGRARRDPLAAKDRSREAGRAAGKGPGADDPGARRPARGTSFSRRLLRGSGSRGRSGVPPKRRRLPDGKAEPAERRCSMVSRRFLPRSSCALLPLLRARSPRSARATVGPREDRGRRRRLGRGGARIRRVPRRRRDGDRCRRDCGVEGDDGPRSPPHGAGPRHRAVRRPRHGDVPLPARNELHAVARPRGRRPAEQPLFRRRPTSPRFPSRTWSAWRSCAGPSRRSTARRRSAASCGSSAKRSADAGVQRERPIRSGECRREGRPRRNPFLRRWFLGDVRLSKDSFLRRPIQ